MTKSQIYVIIIIIIIIMLSFLVIGLFFVVLLFNQRRPPPLRLQASHCITFRIMCYVPSIAVICNETVECFPGIASTFSFKPFVTLPVAPIITGILLLLLLSSSSSSSLSSLLSSLCRVFKIIHLKRTMFLGYIMLELCATCNVISPVKYVLYFYISPLSAVCVQCPIWLFLVHP